MDLFKFYYSLTVDSTFNTNYNYRCREGHGQHLDIVPPSDSLFRGPGTLKPSFCHRHINI